MIQLMRKDFRIYRAAFIAAAIAIVLPSLFAIGDIVFHFSADPDAVGDYFPAVGLLSAVIVAAIFGGSAFAVERRDRSAEFLAMLPVSRWDVAVSKLLLAAMVLAPWIFDTSLCFAFKWDNGSVKNEGIEYLAISGSAMAAAFGVSWLVGQLITSPAIAACSGLGFVLLAVFCAGEARELFSRWPLTESIMITADVAAGVFCVIAGTCICVRRVSP